MLLALSSHQAAGDLEGGGSGQLVWLAPPIVVTDTSEPGRMSIICTEGQGVE